MAQCYKNYKIITFRVVGWYFILTSVLGWILGMSNRRTVCSVLVRKIAPLLG